MMTETELTHKLIISRTPTDWPESTEATPGTQFTLPVDHLSHGLSHTVFATSTDDQRPAIGTVLICSDTRRNAHALAKKLFS